MRAKIASRANGHPFEKRFLELSPEQLTVLYQHAIEAEKQDATEKIEFAKVFFEAGVEHFSSFFEQLKLFVNPQLFKYSREMRQMEEYREEIKEEDFPAEWDRIKSIIPVELVIDNTPTFVGNPFPPVSPEDEEIMAGWVPYSETMK